jgi:hypothetical protein
MDKVNAKGKSSVSSVQRRLPELNLVTLFTFPAHPFNCFFYDKWRNCSQRFLISVRTINRDQFSTSNSSSIIFFLFLEDVGRVVDISNGCFIGEPALIRSLRS